MGTTRCSLVQLHRLRLRWEQARSASLVSDSAKRQEGRLRSQQQKALQALLKRIQRDRGEQLLDTDEGWGWGWGADGHNVIVLVADLYKKQHLEFQRAEAAIRSIMSQPEHAQRLLDEHDPASVARSAALGEFLGASGSSAIVVAGCAVEPGLVGGFTAGRWVVLDIVGHSLWV
eukprot:Skav228822  [mRNA]  locus=scaffold359:458760:460679:+ [translate_table: standard]